MKIWGLQFESRIIDGQIWWFPTIHKPFFENGWNIGLNEKFLREAIKKGVAKFVIKVGEREVFMTPPDEKQLKQKVENKEYEEMPSMFQGSPPLKIFKFRL